MFVIESGGILVGPFATAEEAGAWLDKRRFAGPGFDRDVRIHQLQSPNG